MPKIVTSLEFIERAMSLHKNSYSYEKTRYTRMCDMVIVTCPIHGDFQVQASNHVKVLPKSPSLNPCGCPVCGKEKTRDRNIQGRLPWKDFIERANTQHNNRYQYDGNGYEGVEKKVSIICPIHGHFRQTGRTHLKGSGCPKCKNSLGQTLIAGTLMKHSVMFLTEHSFVDCIGDDKPLKFDFFVPDCNLLIEYDGEQHFKPVRFHKRMSQQQATDMFERVQRYDKIKNNYAEKRGFLMLRIPYTEIKNIPNVVTSYISPHNKVIVGETV